MQKAPLPPRSAEELTEQARSAGLGSRTARRFVDSALRRRGRGPLSGTAWPEFVRPPSGAKYAGPAATIDSGLWLKKLGMTLWFPPVAAKLAAAGLPLVENCRVSLQGWEHDGCLGLDLQYRKVGGMREYSTCRVPIQACINHDQDWVLSYVLAHLGGRNVKMLERTIFHETDMGAVAG